jgi:hypothetical protein
MAEWQGADLHVVDHWTYLGTARTEEELAELGARESSAAFDVDVYRILVRYLAKKPNLDWLDLRHTAAAAYNAARPTSAH